MPKLSQKYEAPDNIVKFQMIVTSDGVTKGVAKRKSNQVDFYYDGMLCIEDNSEIETTLQA